ncbi:MAG: hypothetical protein H0T94_02680, partial [Acidimicrobiia bacterium]|nr:hypothetical protein [Acidimicrobiia bacterium]
MTRPSRIRIALALTALAVAWPVLDILGRNAEFFIARASTRTEVIVVLVLLAIAVPLAGTLPAAMPGRVGRWLASIWLGLLSIALGYLIVRAIDLPFPEVLALLLGGLILFALLR